MSKQIVLFTRLTDNEEWKVWQNMWSKKNPNQQIPNDKLEFIQNNIPLIVKNGKDLLGNIPADPSDENMAFSFLQNLYNQIKDYKDSEIIIAIHFGGGRTYEDSLQPWIEHFVKKGEQEQKGIAQFLLDNFNKPNKPILTHYSIGTGSKKEIEEYIKNEILNDLANYYNIFKKKTCNN